MSDIFSRIEKLQKAIGEEGKAIAKRLGQIYHQTTGKDWEFGDSVGVHLMVADTVAMILSSNWNGVLEAVNEDNYLEALSVLGSGELKEEDWFVAISVANLSWKSSLPPCILWQHKNTQFSQLSAEARAFYKAYLMAAARFLLERVGKVKV